MRRVLVLALLSALSACASPAPQPSAAVSPSATVSSATVNPRGSARAYCFESRGVWRAAAGICDYQSPE